MIIANLATYPKRQKFLRTVVEAIAPQVDRLNLVLNEFEAVPSELLGYGNIVPILPEEDTKDVGKFYPDVSGAEYVMLFDDDILYPPDYVAKTVSRFEALGNRTAIGSYHGSIYRRPEFNNRRDRNNPGGIGMGVFGRLIEYPRELYSYKTRLADFRDVFVFYKEQHAPIIVDQIASGVAILKARDFPPYSYMAGSQKFVDVRLARWAFERGLTGVTLPRESGWLRPLRYEETIFNDFTEKNPEHVNVEIKTFAGRVPHAGEVLK
ncbi:glycosyltransferase family A protein [Ruegeria sp.]|uniref:glycosyltransferase family A protein n=1 Tax=Ruegeria sp. TaxID=1879320 RepID=UPI003C7C2EB9